MAELLTGERKRKRDLEKLAREEARVNAEFQKRASERRTAPSRVTLELTATQEGQVDVELSYRTRAARWRPLYEARLTENRRKLDLVLYAAVTQNTGENWSDVRLEISNARPSRSLAVPVYTAGQTVDWLKQPPRLRRAPAPMMLAPRRCRSSPWSATSWHRHLRRGGRGSLRQRHRGSLGPGRHLPGGRRQGGPLGQRTPPLQGAGQGGGACAHRLRHAAPGHYGLPAGALPGARRPAPLPGLARGALRGEPAPRAKRPWPCPPPASPSPWASALTRRCASPSAGWTRSSSRWVPSARSGSGPSGSRWKLDNDGCRDTGRGGAGPHPQARQRSGEDQPPAGLQRPAGPSPSPACAAGRSSWAPRSRSAWSCPSPSGHPRTASSRAWKTSSPASTDPP